MTPHNYSKEDYLCLTDDEKTAHYFEQKEFIDKLNEELDIAQEGLLELQKELTLKRHAIEENEKLFALAKELKAENDELKQSIPNSEKEHEEFQSLKALVEKLESENSVIVQEKIYFAELISEYEKETSKWKEEQKLHLQQLESLRSQEIADPTSDLKSELIKKGEENALLLSEIGKIKIIVVQGMKEAKDLKNKYLTLLQSYEEINNKKNTQENLINALQSKLHETTILKNRFEQDHKNAKSEIDRIGELLTSTQDSFEKELLLARQLLAKKVKESSQLQDKLEELESSYQSKIKLLISESQDRLEILEIQNQKLARDKESALKQEALFEVKELLEPILEKIKAKLNQDKSCESSRQNNFEESHEENSDRSQRFSSFNSRSSESGAGENSYGSQSFSGNRHEQSEESSSEKEFRQIEEVINLVPDWKHQELKTYSLFNEE